MAVPHKVPWRDLNKVTRTNSHLEFEVQRGHIISEGHGNVPITHASTDKVDNYTKNVNKKTNESSANHWKW